MIEAEPVQAGNASENEILSNRIGSEYTRISHNIISANWNTGIFIGRDATHQHFSHHTTVDSNIIGLDQNGRMVLANKNDGVLVLGPSYSNSIEWNTISGNKKNGVCISNGGSNNYIDENKIGTDSTGTYSAANNGSGILVIRTPDIWIMDNLVSGNDKAQIKLIDMTGVYNTILGNNIGPSIKGNEPLSNDFYTSEFGVVVNNSNVVIEVNEIAYNKTGLHCSKRSRGEVVATYFYNNDLAIKVEESPITIANNAVWDNHRGIDVQDNRTANLIIAGNEIFDNTSINSGIHLIDAYAQIFANSFYGDAGDAIVNQGSGSPIIRDNSIINNEGLGLNHKGSAASIDARYNCWGAPDGPGAAGPESGEGVSSGVNYKSWRTDSIDLLVYTQSDTIFLRADKPAWATVYFCNWVGKGDDAVYTVRADKDWLESTEEQSIKLYNLTGGIDFIWFDIPAGTPVGATANIEVSAESVVNAAHRDTARFMVVVASQEAEHIILFSDSVSVFPGEKVLFSATAMNQFYIASLKAEWQCTGGEIDDSGLYVAGDEPGIYTVTVTDKASGTFAEAVITIKAGTGVADDPSGLPEQFALYPNYPNPFNPVTTIRYDIAEPTHVVIEIYNILGKKVRTLIDHGRSPGACEIKWNRCDDSGTPVAAGIYFYRMRTAEFTKCGKMMLLP